LVKYIFTDMKQIDLMESVRLFGKKKC